MKRMTSDDIEDMRALRRQEASMVFVKAFFRDAGFTDDQTIMAWWLQIHTDDLKAVARKVNARFLSNQVVNPPLLRT